MTIKLIDGSSADLSGNEPIGIASYPEGEEVVEEHFMHYFVSVSATWKEISLAVFNQLLASGHPAQNIIAS